MIDAYKNGNASLFAYIFLFFFGSFNLKEFHAKHGNIMANTVLTFYSILNHSSLQTSSNPLLTLDL